VVELEAGLARERQAHDVAADAGNVGVNVAEVARRFVETGEREQLLRPWPGDVDCGERHGPVHHVDAEAPRLDPVAEPHLRIRGATGRERENEPRLGLAQDHPVVHHVATLVEQECVARASGLDVGDVAGIEPLQRLNGVRAGHDELAERRHITE
jgi:hypothetical protein